MIGLTLGFIIASTFQPVKRAFKEDIYPFSNEKEKLWEKYLPEKGLLLLSPFRLRDV